MTPVKILTFCLVVMTASFSLAFSQEEAALKAETDKAAVDVTIGASIYKSKCAFCHGDNGDGQGPSGKFLKPPPGDFTDSQWIHGGEMEDIVKVIREGVDGTAMVGFASALTEEEIEAIAAFVQQFSKPVEEPSEESEAQE